MGPHCKHDYKPVSEKSKEVRKVVFDYPNQFNELTKQLARRKSFAKQYNESEICRNSSYSDDFIDLLCATFERLIRSKASGWQKIAQRQLKEFRLTNLFFDIAAGADRQITKLCKLLTMSDSACSCDFFMMKDGIVSSLGRQRTVLQNLEAAVWCQNLNELLDTAVESSLLRWKLPYVKSWTTSVVRS